MARDNQLLITAVVITGTVALIWTFGRSVDPALGGGDSPDDPDVGPQKLLTELHKEFDRMRQELLPTDITQSHDLNKEGAARFTEMGDRLDALAESIERSDPASEEIRTRAVQLASEAHGLATNGPSEDALMQHVPADSPVPTQPKKKRRREEDPPRFDEGPAVTEGGTTPSFNTATSNVDKIEKAFTTNSSTSDRTGSDNAVYSTIPPRTEIPASVPDRIENVDADQNAAGYNVPQAAVQADGMAPITAPNPGTENFTAVEREPETSAERITSQNENTGKVTKRPVAKVTVAPPFNVSFNTDPNAIDMEDPTQNERMAPAMAPEDSEQVAFRQSILRSAKTTEQQVESKRPAVYRVLMNRMKVAENLTEAKRLAQIMYSLKPDGRTNTGKVWKLNLEAIDEEHRSRFNGKSMSGYFGQGGQERAGKRKKPSPPDPPQPGQAGAGAGGTDGGLKVV